jgi:hypothetical protein
MALPGKIPPPIAPRPERAPTPPPPPPEKKFLGGRDYVRPEEFTRSLLGSKCYEATKIPEETRRQLKKIFTETFREGIGQSKREVIQQTIDYLKGTGYPSSETARKLGEEIKKIFGGSTYKAKTFAEYVKKELWK